jgi:hypothetical protein
MTHVKTTTACDEMTRSALGPAGAGEAPGAADNFDDLLAASSFGPPTSDGGAPEAAHRRLDEKLKQFHSSDTTAEGDIDDALVHLVDRASRIIDGNHRLCYDATNMLRQRPTWVFPTDASHWAVDRAGSEVIYLRYLPARDSQQVVAFVEYSDPWSAQAVIADLAETNVFATVRPDVARVLVSLAFDRQTRSQAILSACEQAIVASGLFDHNDLGQVTEEREGDVPRSGSQHTAVPFSARVATNSPRGPTQLTSLEVRACADIEVYEPRWRTERSASHVRWEVTHYLARASRKPSRHRSCLEDPAPSQSATPHKLRLRHVLDALGLHRLAAAIASAVAATVTFIIIAR